MKQHVVHDQIAVRYSDEVDEVWKAWEPHLRRCELAFNEPDWQVQLNAEDLADQLRRAQYRAHVAGEVTAGLVPPPSASDAHALLINSLAACRDTLGVLALRAEMYELDTDAMEIGLHSVDTTRDAFYGARSSTALVHAWIAEDRVDPAWITDRPRGSHRAGAVLFWLLVAMCISLFVVLVADMASVGLLS